MKKKLLTLLLSIAVILTSTVTVFAGEISTIANILPQDFPTEAVNGWVSGTKHLYLSGFTLCVDGDPVANTKLSVENIQNTNDYKCIIEVGPGTTIIFTFEMNDENKLEKVIIEGDEIFNGTYIAPAPNPGPGTLTITKDGQPATFGTDYRWAMLTAGQFDLQILENNLTISGTDTSNNIKIVTDTNVSNLTMEDLTLESSRNEGIIACSSSITITVKGENSITNPEDGSSVILVEGNLKLTGDGNLTVAESSNIGTVCVVAYETLELNMTGKLICNGACYGVICEEFKVSNNIGKVIAYGNTDDYGAINWYGTTSIGDEVKIFGSATYNAPEANITEEAEVARAGDVGDPYSRIDVSEGTVAKSVLMTGPIKKAYITIADYDVTNPVAENITGNEYYSVEDYYFYFLKDNKFLYTYDHYDGWRDSSLNTLGSAPDVSECDVVIEWFELNCTNGIFSDDIEIYVNGNEDDNILPNDTAGKMKTLKDALLNQEEIIIDTSYSVHGNVTDGIYGQKTMINCNYVLYPKFYEVIEGIDITINVDNNKDVLFVSNASYDKFFVDKQLIGKVLVDDKEIDSSNYRHASGSTEVTLKVSYLSTLSNGKHTLTIVSSDGEASTTFTITRNPKPNPGYIVPNTGVN